MATSTINVNRVYPPIVNSSIPAYLATAESLNINFWIVTLVKKPQFFA